MRTEDEALELAKEIAAFLKEKHGATRVLLFGSRAKGTSTLESDIDIYFEGVPRERALRAVGQCIYNFGEDGIDYRPDCLCEAEFRKRILAHATPL